MAATLTLSKIEIGFQYTTSSTEGIIDSKGAVGHANTNISYYANTSSTQEITGAGYGDINMESSDTFDIVLGLGGSSLTYYPIQNITPSIYKRTTITPANSLAADVKPYYNDGRYANPTFTLNADDNNIAPGKTLYLFPLIDITFDVSGDDGSFISERKDFVYLENAYHAILDHNAIVKGPDNYTIPSTKYLSAATYNDNYPFVLISSDDNTKKFPGVFSPNLNASLHGVYQISGLFFDSGYIDMENWIGNISAFARLGHGSNSNLYSYQGVCDMIKFNERVSQFTIRCVCPTYMASVVVPAPIYTGQATATVTLPIKRTSDIYSSKVSPGSQYNIQFTVTRNQLDYSTVMPYNISISNYAIYNRVYTKDLSSSDTADIATEFRLQDIGSHQEFDNTQYAIYKNLIYTPAEKNDIAHYNINDDMRLTTKYGDTLLRLCKRNSNYDPDKDFIYEYFLYYKPSISDVQGSSTEFIKRIVLESINVEYNTQDLKNFEQLDVTCYWFPNANKLSSGVDFSNLGDITDDITIANNALMSYPIGTDVMLGYSNYYLRLADLNEAAWYNFANANLQYTYTHKPGTSGTGTMQFNLSNAFDSSDGMQDIYSDYNAFLTSLRIQFYNNVIDDDNILFTSIPMLIRVKTTTKGKDEYNEVYLIKIIVDLRKLRAERTNDLKLLSNSDFIKSGYFRSTYDSDLDSSSRLFTNLYLDNSTDSDVSNKVMSSIDIINKNLYVFDPEGKHIKTITQNDIIDIEGSNVKYNTVINYIDMYNIADVTSTSAVVGSKDLQYVIANSYTHNWITEEEYQYMRNDLPDNNASLLSSVFNNDHPVNSYKSCTENFDPNDGLILENSEKGYGIFVLASISKDYNNILNGGVADSLLTPLSRYEDVFLSTESLTNCHIICISDNIPLDKSAIITNPRK